MKQILFMTLAVFLLAACGEQNAKKEIETTGIETEMEASDDSTVFVYYFHGKQRCKTCVAVGDITKRTIDEHYSDNGNVRFVEVETEEASNSSLVERYEVMWNALIIARAGDDVEITNEAFANAANNPELLSVLIIAEVDKRL